MRGILYGPGRLLPVLGAVALPVAINPDDTKAVVGLLGDSITYTNTPTSSGDINRGYWHWAQAISGFRAYCGAYAGVGGNVTSQMLGRLNADIITPLAAYAGRDRYCLVMGGVNDSVNDADIIAAATDNLTQIYNELIAAGITPIACTITPTTSASTAQRQANWIGINDWLRTYCPANGIALCDNIAACLDGSYPPAGTPTWKMGYTHDGVHPTAAGGVAIAKTIATTLQTLLPAVPHFDAGTADFAGSILDNHAMTGTGGTLGSGGSGVVADYWQVANGVASKVARSDSVSGEWQVLAIGAASVRLNPATGIDLSSGFAVGNKIVGQAEVYCVDDWDTITQLNLVLEFRDGSGAIDALTFLANDPNTGTIPNPAPNGSITLRTVPTVVPAGTTTIRTYVYFVGASGTIRVGRYELLKIAPAA